MTLSVILLMLDRDAHRERPIEPNSYMCGLMHGAYPDYFIALHLKKVSMAASCQYGVVWARQRLWSQRL
jgi:hypothetical protein